MLENKKNKWKKKVQETKKCWSSTPIFVIMIWEKDITIEVTNSAKDVMVREGYDPVYGARLLKRYIGNTLETIIAKKLIAGDVYNGCTIVIDGKDENIEVLVK